MASVRVKKDEDINRAIKRFKRKVEKEGIKRTREAIKEADVVIYVVSKDSHTPQTRETRRSIVVFNKSDIYKKPVKFQNALEVSALKNKNIRKLKDEILNALKERETKYSDILITTQRQFDCVGRCLIFLKKRLFL